MKYQDHNFQAKNKKSITFLIYMNSHLQLGEVYTQSPKAVLLILFFPSFSTIPFVLSWKLQL